MCRYSASLYRLSWLARYFGCAFRLSRIVASMRTDDCAISS
jgi:hypothetical protein